MAGTEKAIYQCHQRDTSAQAASDIQEREMVWVNGTSMFMFQNAAGQARYVMAGDNTIGLDKVLVRDGANNLIGSAMSGNGEILRGTGFVAATGSFTGLMKSNTGSFSSSVQTDGNITIKPTNSLFCDDLDSATGGIIQISAFGTFASGMKSTFGTFTGDLKSATGTFTTGMSSVKGKYTGVVDLNTSDNTNAFTVTAADATDNFRMRGRLDGGSAILELYNDDDTIKVSLDSGGVSEFGNGVKSTTGSFSGIMTTNGLGTFSGGLRSTTGSFTGAITTNAVGTFSGGMKSTTGTYSGALQSTGLVTANGGINTTAGTFSSGLKSTTGSFTGDVTANVGTITNTLLTGSVNTSVLTVNGYDVSVEEGTFIGTFGGYTSPIIAQQNYSKVGNMVSIIFNNAPSGSSTDEFLLMTGFPDSIKNSSGNSKTLFPGPTDNGTVQPYCQFNMGNNGTCWFEFWNGAAYNSGGWTGSANKGFVNDSTVTYIITP